MECAPEVILEPANRTVTFNQLLGQLRSAHEEVCARNALLESQVTHNGTQFEKQVSNGAQLEMQVSNGTQLEVQVSPSESKAETKEESKPHDPWLPINFVAPVEGSPLGRLPWLTPTPRSFEVRTKDTPRSSGAYDVHPIYVLANRLEFLRQSMDSLAKQQEGLGLQITREFTLSAQAFTLSTAPLQKSIDSLAVQQECLSQQIAKAIASFSTASQAALAHAAPLVSRPPSLRHKSTRLSHSFSTLSLHDHHHDHHHHHHDHHDHHHRHDHHDHHHEQDHHHHDAPQGDAHDAAGFASARQSPRPSARPSTRPSVRQSARHSMHSNSSKGPVEKKASERFKVSTGRTRDLSELCRAEFGEDPVLEDETHISRARELLRSMLHSPLFSIASSLLILSYAGLIAVETDMIAKDPDMDSLTIKCLHYLYTFTFCAELSLRVAAYGWATWCGVDAFWNRLDAFLISFGLAEIIMENTISAATDARAVVRGVRIGRVIRTVRIIRTFRQFHDFQKMAYALISSFKTLICSLALLIFVMFFFAVWLTQSSAELEMRGRIPDLDLRYGDLISTTYTLFLSVSNGISWDLCFQPLHKLSWVTAQVFILYIVIVLFGVLNVVTSVFVESVIRSVQHYKDLIVQDKEEEKKIAAAHVREVFQRVDSNGSGQVSIEEMEFFLRDPDLRMYMEALDIESSDTILLFRLLDLDGSGVVDVDEFCEGCLRLKGNAKSIDIHTLTFRITNFLDRWVEFTDYVEESLSHIHGKI